MYNLWLSVLYGPD